MKIRIAVGTSEYRACVCEPGERADAVLMREGIYLAKPCGGMGICGKCRIRFTENAPEPSAADQRLLTDEEREDGWRLACRCRIVEPCSMKVSCESSEENMDIQMAAQVHEAGLNLRQAAAPAGDGPAQADSMDGAGQRGDGSPAYGIACDIGTTTLAMELVDLRSGRAVGTWSGVNHQRAYGADVMSRITYANRSVEHLKELEQIIRRDLAEGIAHLAGTLKEGDQRERAEKSDPAAAAGHDCGGQIARMVIAGNTTMIHLLMGYSVAGLGAAPFTPVTLDEVHTRICGIPCDIFPGISAFVGGDITAGIYARDLDRSDEPGMLLDLGTNGEMVLCADHHLVTTSVSAGPAFEGGNITCGMPSIPGAITSVMILGRFCRVVTAGNQPARGMCGTGILEGVSELLRNHLIDSHGTYLPQYQESGYPFADGVTLTQDDIRQVQLAKASIRAGIDVLILSSGITCEKLTRVCIAGGFGFRLDVKKAAVLGIIPEELTGVCEAAGNTALSGAVKYLLHPEDESRIRALVKRAEPVSLADSDEFHRLYILNMEFS